MQNHKNNTKKSQDKVQKNKKPSKSNKSNKTYKVQKHTCRAPAGDNRLLTIYTVSHSEYVHGIGIEHNVIGSYLVRGDAIRECADLIIEKLQNLGEIRWAATFCSGGDFWRAMEKAGFKKSKVEKIFDGQGRIEFQPKFRNALKAYLVDALGDESCYILKPSGADLEFRFDIDENDVQTDGGLRVWTCVTTGRKVGCEDPEFEDAFPETFLTSEDAINCALDDLEQWLDGYSDERKKSILDEAMKDLRRHSQFTFWANDTTARSWNIWTSFVGLGYER